MNKVRKKLVLVEWVDSIQATSGWAFLSDPPDLEIVRCKSVGWVAEESNDVLMLVPNIGNIDTESEQGMAFIRIPKVSIVSKKVLG